MLPGSIPAQEWEWRRNYRVWEANRKVFLYPENYVDPGLRDTKTPLFKALEDELLQQNITMNSAEDAYKKYLAQFVELSHLRYAGAYYNFVDNSPFKAVDTSSQQVSGKRTTTRMAVRSYPFSDRFIDKDKTIYYFFARTHLQPYRYYYRTFNAYSNLWGHWENINVPIEADEISAIIHNGKLHIYWTEVQHKVISQIKGGDATSDSVSFNVTTKYSCLDASNKWTTPQRLYLGKVSVSYVDIFRRLEMPFDESHADEAVEKYKLEVFKKPYVSTASQDDKLNIRHIYTPGKNIKTKKFKTRSTSLSYKQHVPATMFSPAYEITHRINIPSITFTETNGTVVFVDQDSIEGIESFTIKSITASSAYIEFIIKDAFKVTLPLQTDLVVEFLELIYVTFYEQELYRYVNEPSLQFIELSDPYIGNTIYNDEYVMAFNNDGTFAHYIEDSNRDFTRRNATIAQVKEGPAHITVNPVNSPLVTPLTTILSDELNIILSEQGLEKFLSLQTQNLSNGAKLDFNGPYGEYYWEMFFHIPFLIANNLNANQDFNGAKWWYERIFNPLSPENPGEIQGEHYWQFREFRNIDITRLQDILTDEATIAVYKKDPFDPHAIARLRISAYQKAIVMKYIDNLLDWGDFLFARDTQESIVEADMLYQLAQDILGKRPEKTGKCETANEDNLNFQNIFDHLQGGSEFLISVENLMRRMEAKNEDRRILKISKFLSSLSATNTTAPPSNTLSELAAISNADTFADFVTQSGSPITETPVVASGVFSYLHIRDLLHMPTATVTAQPSDMISASNTPVYDEEAPIPASDIIAQSNLAFCVPANDGLLQYWDTVDDRLFKIRNCMNISGVRRSLALYQPPIDPMLLVRAKVVGLSIEDIASEISLSQSLPAYRFNYMLEKAKQFTQNVQGFGIALLSALEKKDGEELMLLRSVHERNILRLTKDIKDKQISDAQQQYAASEESIANIQNRINYYNGLLGEGLTSWENVQQFTRKRATEIQITSTAFYGNSSLLALLPQLGSPFSLNWGGKQQSDAAKAWGNFLNDTASILESISSSAGLEATFQRRKEEWKFQLATATQELRQATAQLLSADLRIKIAERDLEIHEKTIDQSAEVDEFFRTKFSNLELYSYTMTTLSRLYRLSYAMALDMAKMAETCYANEIYDDTKFIEGDNWQNERAGFLAGERLMLQLNMMEKSYMSLYGRSPEITQNFSLALMDPLALIQLKQTGNCTIQIPEIAFDLLYPGHFRRLIRGIRISIPCIAGPFTNISAQLKLKTSSIRKHLGEIPTVIQVAKDTSIATSSAINDSGSFEFNFRDERYLPFEYAGAVSEWKLNLPSKIRAFNYQTVSDVIIHMNYTAQEGDRDTVEDNLLQDLRTYSETEGLVKAVSLKYEFPDKLHDLVNRDSASITFNLTANYLPCFLADLPLSISEASLFIKPKKGLSAYVPELMMINNTHAVNWDAANDIRLADDGSETDIIKFGKIISLTASPLREWTIDAGDNWIGKENTEDILILFRYRVI